MRATDIARLESKYTPEPNSGCWLWTASADQKGYGFFWLNGKLRRAHAAAYELLVGQIPLGLELDHLCSVRCCVNPDHLEPVTHRENIKRGRTGEAIAARNREKTHCPKGHPYSGDNLYAWRGKRLCKTCRNAGNRDLLRRKACA
jgi:hypothetical protein